MIHLEKDTAETIVKVYAVLAWVGALFALIAGAVMIFGGSLFGAFLIPGGYAGNAGLGFFGVFYILFGIFLIAVAVFDAIVGYGLWNRKPWARVTVLIMSVLDLFSFPIGTIIGVAGIWLFGFDETIKGIFGQQGADIFSTRTTGVAAKRR